MESISKIQLRLNAANLFEPQFTISISEQLDIFKVVS